MSILSHISCTHLIQESPSPAPSTPPRPPKTPLGTRVLRAFGAASLLVIGAGAVFVYYAKKDRTPGTQLPHSPDKKTIVILGSGWGATSLLNSLDTEDYNVVSSHAPIIFQ